jgi:DNA repair protein RadC
MALRASKVYLAHNHLSNIALPSKADMNSTMVIRTALAGVGVELVDHLVFVDGDMVSMKESQRYIELL